MGLGGSVAEQGASGLNNIGLRLVSNDELEKRRLSAIERQNTPLIIGLSSYLQKAWESARQSKEPIQRQLLECLRQRKGQYEAKVLQEIRQQGGSEIFMLLTAEKCRALKALIRDIVVQPNDSPWELEPSEVSELPPHIQENIRAQLQQEIMMAAEQAGQEIPQEAIDEALGNMHDTVLTEMKKQAEHAAKRMKSELKDQLEEGGFPQALDLFIDDFVTHKAAFLKGPILRKRKSLKWQQIDGGYKPVEGETIFKDTDHVSPFDIYPSSDAKDIQDGYLFERMRLSIQSLNEMKGVPGYDSDAISQVILEYGRGGLREWLAQDYERSAVEGRPYEYQNPSTKIDAISYWGTAPGFMLVEWGMNEKKVPDITKDYQINAIKIGRWIIRAVINPHPLGRRPYYKACFDCDAGSFWGNALPEVIRDDQEMCNGAARACANNMGLASGPQVSFNDIDRLPPGTDLTNIYPWKIYQFTGDDMSTGTYRPPIEFFQPNIITAELLAVMETFSKAADEHSGIPNYMTDGKAATGAGDTATGLSMLMGQSSKGIKRIIGEIDRNVIEEIVEEYYIHEMIYGKDKTLKGDLRIVARASTALLVKEQQQVRRIEFLQTTNNPIDYQLMGPQGRAVILREVAKSLDIPVDDIVPNPDDVQSQNRNAAMLQGGVQPQQQPQQQQNPGMRILGPDGRPISGQDSATFQQSNVTTPGGM